MRFRDSEMIEHRERVGVEMPVGVDLGRGRHIRGRITAGGIGDAAVAAREVSHLRLPIGVVGREFVQEDDRRSLARLLEIETDIVARCGVRHLSFLLAGRLPKIAVNARGCNEAGTGFPRQGIIAESPRNRFRTAASRLAVAIARIAYEPRMSAPGASFENEDALGRWGMGGVSQRNEYGSVGCVLP